MTHSSETGDSDKDPSMADTLREGALKEAQDMAKFGLDVEELAGREAGLLQAYLAEDADAAKAYWQELKNELLLLAEYRAESWLATAASPAVINWLRLDFCMHRDASQLLAGEVAANQELSCLECGQRIQIQAPVTLQACKGCGCELFAARPLMTQ